jgi:hypothetical protein
MDSPYLAGVQAKQTYSFYSGCSITMGSNAVWLVEGWPTTYGFDSDNDRLGGTYVSAANKTIPADTGIGKGNVVAVAEETLPGGGKLFVGGTVFYSNFEIKVQLDNYGQTQNSNYNIVMNILDSVRRVIPVTDISVIRAGNMGDVYCAQGTVTAGTTPGNAFFDTIYIEDATGGINIFPVSGTDIKVGQKVKVTGTLDQYQGDPELRMLELSITDPSINPIEPAVMSTQAAMNSMNGVRFIRVEGTVIRMDSQNLYIDDGSGEARIFVDGYIGDGTNDPAKLGKWDPNILVGDKVNAVGLASADSSGPRLRVRNTAEIVRMDTVPPVITVVGVENGDRFTLFERAAVQWSASDALSGIAASSGDIVSGENLDTETVGPHTLNFTASDNAGNAASLSITYYVEYDFSGFLSPAGMDKSFKAGSSIPVKFAITDAGAGYPADAAAKLYVARMTDGKAEDEFPAVSKSAAAEGNQFRYDTDSKQYIFNLDTKGFAPGEYRLRIDLGDGTVNILVITLK